MFRAPNIVHQKVMGQVGKNMKEYVIHQMAITDQIVQSHSRQGIGRNRRINQKTPIYRKYVRRREKIETIKSQEISIQVIFTIDSCQFSLLLSFGVKRSSFTFVDCARSPKDKRIRESEHRTNHDRSDDKTILNQIKVSQTLSSRDRKPMHNNCLDKVSYF